MPPRQPKSKAKKIIAKLKEYQGMIVGGLATISAIGALLLFGNAVMNSDGPPVAGIKRVAQIQTGLEKHLDKEIEAQRTYNAQERRSRDETESALCTLFAGVEAKNRAAVAANPRDESAQAAYLLNSGLRRKWCKDAIK